MWCLLYLTLVISVNSELMHVCRIAWDKWSKKTFVAKLLFHPTLILTSDLANIEYVLKTNFENYPKGPVMKFRFQSLLGDGIFNAE
jgi:hypothetical protein